MSDAAAVRAAADRIAAEFGGAELLFNNAGVMLPAPVDERRSDLWQREIDTNVADLINTSSIAAQNTYPSFAVYCGTKAFVTHSSRQLRAELGSKNVRVSVVEPGLVRTELQDHVTDQGANDWLDSVKDSLEWLVAEDIARTVGFIAALPPRVNIQQVTAMPTAQAS